MGKYMPLKKTNYPMSSPTLSHAAFFKYLLGTFQFPLLLVGTPAQKSLHNATVGKFDLMLQLGKLSCLTWAHSVAAQNVATQCWSDLICAKRCKSLCTHCNNVTTRQVILLDLSSFSSSTKREFTVLIRSSLRYKALSTYTSQRRLVRSCYSPMEGRQEMR